MSIPLVRRYQDVSTAAEEQGFIVRLDGKALETPAKRPLVLPSKGLATAIADEWQAQDGRLDFTKLPLTQLAMTAQELPVDTAGLLEFLQTELIVHYADDQVLADVQDKLWQPLQAWLAERFGTMLPRVIGILPGQDPVQPGSLADYLAGLDNFRLTALSEAASALGSFVIALALIEGRVDVAGAVAAAEIDSDYQMLRWGEDPDIMQRRVALQAELEAIVRFVDLLG